MWIYSYTHIPNNSHAEHVKVVHFTAFGIKRNFVYYAASMRLRTIQPSFSNIMASIHLDYYEEELHTSADFYDIMWLLLRAVKNTHSIRPRINEITPLWKRGVVKLEFCGWKCKSDCQRLWCVFFQKKKNSSKCDR